MKRFFLLFAALLVACCTFAQTLKLYKDSVLVQTIPAGSYDEIRFEDDSDADDHRYVDLGLPSGTLWATCNVGALLPYDTGSYFAWGETKQKAITRYSWASYSFFDRADSTMTRYCVDSIYGKVDNRTTLEAADDAATVNGGPEWQTPTSAQLEELVHGGYTSLDWTSLDGQIGFLIRSTVEGYTTNYIFLPAAGIYQEGALKSYNSCGYYWSRDLDTRNSSKALDLSFWMWEQYTYSDYDRYLGHNVRPVRRTEKFVH